MFAIFNFCAICSFSRSNYATLYTSTNLSIVGNPISGNKDSTLAYMASSVMPAPQKMLVASFHTYDDAITSLPTVIAIPSESLVTREAATTSMKSSHISNKGISGGRSPTEESKKIKLPKNSTFPLGKKSY